MLNNTFFSLSLWIGTGIELFLLVFITRKKLWSQWRSLGVYCICELVFDFALALNRSVYRRYFYIYWASVAISSLMRLWILSDVLESFPGVAFLRKELRWVVSIAGTTMAAGSWYVAFHGTKILVAQIPTAVLNLDRCVSIAWGGFYVAALAGIVIFHLAWSKRGAMVANGLLLKTVAAVITSHLLSSISRETRMLGSYLISVTSLATVTIWLLAISHREETYIAGSDIIATFGANKQIEST